MTIWLAAAAIALGTGLVALRLVGATLIDEPLQPLGSGEIEQLIAESTPLHQAATSAPYADRDDWRMLARPGGSVLVSCTPSGGITLLSWAPEPGYTATVADAGSGGQVEIVFQADQQTSRTVVVCRNGEAVPQ